MARGEDIVEHVFPTETDIEDGVALIARAMFRKGDKGAGNDPQAAHDIGMAVVSTVRSMAFDFLRQAEGK